MDPYYIQKNESIFNDYKLPTSPQNKYLINQKSQSTGNIFINDNTLKQKPTVILSKDNIKTQIKGQYMINQDIIRSEINMRTKLHSRQQSQLSEKNININESNSVTNTFRLKSKTKSIRSSSPLTPLKIMKLKKSLIKQKSQTNSVVSCTEQQSNQPSKKSFKINFGHKKSNTGLFITSNSQSQFETVKREIYQNFNNKIKQFNDKIQYQSQIIYHLTRKLQENKRTINNSNKIIQDLKIKIFQSQYKQKNGLYVPINKTNEYINNEAYYLNRINDIQTKFQIFKSTNIDQIENRQSNISSKLQNLENSLIKYTSIKLNQLKLNLSNFINEKTSIISNLSQMISYIDNKVISRSQLLKQALAQLKMKVKSIEDTCTKDSFNHIEDDISDIPVINTFKTLKNNQKDNQSPLNRKSKHQDSLNYSLTSCDKISKKNIINQHTNVHDILNQMSDLDATRYIQQNKIEFSKLSDDFYHQNKSFRNISPILSKNNTNTTKYTDNQSNLNLAPPKFLKSDTNSQTEASNFNGSLKIDSQTMNKKISAIKDLIEDKKRTIQLNDQCNENFLRCYIDKSGYLKYVDSKTFVFDKKGNLIQCSEGQFWVLVTKGLIFGKEDEIILSEVQ